MMTKWQRVRSNCKTWTMNEMNGRRNSRGGFVSRIRQLCFASSFSSGCPQWEEEMGKWEEVGAPTSSHQQAPDGTFLTTTRLPASRLPCFVFCICLGQQIKIQIQFFWVGRSTPARLSPQGKLFRHHLFSAVIIDFLIFSLWICFQFLIVREAAGQWLVGTESSVSRSRPPTTLPLSFDAPDHQFKFKFKFEQITTTDHPPPLLWYTWSSLWIWFKFNI